MVDPVHNATLAGNGTHSDNQSYYGKNVDYSAIIIGAGFAGLRMLHEMRMLGLSAKVFEAGDDVGGTWYWNSYPGARTDSEAWCYILNFSKELKSDWVWTERYPTQGEVHRYLKHVADRFDMRKDIQFQARIQTARYDAENVVWKVTNADGSSYTCTFLIAATGVLSTGLDVPYPGLESFKGKWYKASNWGKEPGNFLGKKVAVIGTGSTAVQIIPTVAHSAESVHVFQRTANYVIPGRNHKITEDQMSEIKRNYDDVWKQARAQIFGFPGMPPTGQTISIVKDEAERQKILDRGWEAGGFRFIFGTFDDIMTDPKSNEMAAEFIRKKIRTVVKDEKTAELLCPHYPLQAKRPALGHFYYEAYNRPNVHLVDISHDTIEGVTPKGLRTSTEEYEFDVIIFAIGFDAVTGALAKIDIRGRSNQSLQETWNSGVETLFGITVKGFPNMFMVTGPQSPFANMPVVIDNTAEWIGRAIRQMRILDARVMEAKSSAIAKWGIHVKDVFESTLLASSSEQVHSWYVGANVPGKPRGVLFYFGGLISFFKQCEEEATGGFPGFNFTKV